MAHSSTARSPAATVSSLSSQSEDVKHHILSYLPPNSKVLAAAPARIYHSAFGAHPDSWTFTGLRGTLVFGRNRASAYPAQGADVEQNYWFRLIDADSGKGIVWFHQIPLNLDYHADKPFFHIFSGCSRMFGFRFDEDSDAEKFLRRITARVQITAPRMPRSRLNKSASPAPSPVPTTPVSATRRVSPSMISAPAPGTFVHVAHVGVDDDGRIEATPNVEPGWTMILEELQGYGVSEKMVTQDLDFVEGFLAGAKANLVHELEATTVAAAATLSRTPTAGARKGRFIQRKRVPVPRV